MIAPHQVLRPLPLPLEGMDQAAVYCQAAGRPLMSLQ